jgi:MarR family transcriptional regulator, lower aerobic nicotinate degradation pathway regulator
MNESVRPPSLLELPSYLASQVSRFGRRYLAEALDRHDLHLVHHAILSALADFGAQSQQQLADTLDVDKSHLVGRLDLLEARDLVRRTPDPEDRRRYRVRLTPAGRRLARKLRPIALRSQERFLDPLTSEERETLLALLRRVLIANDAVRLGTVDDAFPSRTPDDDRAPPV